MPAQFGIVCDHCRKLHLISSNTKSSRIQYDRLRGEFKLKCVPPCTAVMYFNRQVLMPFEVPVDALERGYAEIEQCTPIVRKR